MAMNSLDLVLLVILTLFALKGALRGLLREVCSLVGLLAATLVASSFYAPLASQLQQWLQLPLLLCVTLVVLLLFLLTMAFFAALGGLLSRVVRLLFLGWFNRVLGALFGLTQGLVLLALVLYGLAQIPLPELVQPAFRRSQLRPAFVDLGEDLLRHGRTVLEQRR